MANGYLPEGDPELVIWFNNFQTKLPAYGPAVGLNTTDTDNVTIDYNMLAYTVALAEAYRQEAKERTAYKNTFRDGPIGLPAPTAPATPVIAPPAQIPNPGIVPRLRALVQRIKSSPGYSVSIGQDLGIVPPDLSSPTPKPTGSARATSGSVVEIKFKKSGFVGVMLESRRSAEAAWTSLGIIVASPYTDNRPPLTPNTPEVRYYRMRYVEGNVPTGDDSDILQVTTIP